MSSGSESPPLSIEPRKYFCDVGLVLDGLEIDLRHLADFFVERHLLQQVFDFYIDGSLSVLLTERGTGLEERNQSRE